MLSLRPGEPVQDGFEPPHLFCQLGFRFSAKALGPSI
jgi:hypothetical protein